MANYIQGISEITQGCMGLVEALKKVDAQTPFALILKGVKDLGFLGVVTTGLKTMAEHVEKAEGAENTEATETDHTDSVAVESA